MEYNLTFKKMYKQFAVINKHRWAVFKMCTKAGYPVRGALHDLSKYSPKEFFELARFQTNGSSPVNTAREVQGYSKAWLHHKGANPHHWEYWTEGYRPGSSRAIKIPFNYVVELFCDYMGAGIVYGQASGNTWSPQSAYDYWEGLRDKYSNIHPETKALIEEWYQLLLLVGLETTLKQLKLYKKKYNNGGYIKENKAGFEKYLDSVHEIVKTQEKETPDPHAKEKSLKDLNRIMETVEANEA